MANENLTISKDLQHQSLTRSGIPLIAEHLRLLGVALRLKDEVTTDSVVESIKVLEDFTLALAEINLDDEA